MTLAKFTATAAVALLGSGAAMAQEATADASGQSFDVVFIDVGGSAVQVPLDLAAQACALPAAELQRTAQTRLDEQGLTPMDVGITAGTATAGAGAGAGGTTETDAANTTQTADANAATDMGNATTDAASADAPAGQTTEMASGDAAATEQLTGQVENVETTAADATAEGDISADADQAQDPFLVLAVCAIDAEQATSLNIDTTQTGETLGLDASRLQPAANQ